MVRGGTVPTVPPRLRHGFRKRLTLRELHDLFLAITCTGLDDIANATFPGILGVPVWRRIGPTGYIHAFGKRDPNDPSYGIGRYLDVGSYLDDRLESNLGLEFGGPFRVPRTASFETRDERAAVIKQWMTRLLLDMGLGGFEDELGSI
jgi:hypothetical protein